MLFSHILSTLYFCVCAFTVPDVLIFFSSFFSDPEQPDHVLTRRMREIIQKRAERGLERTLEMMVDNGARLRKSYVFDTEGNNFFVCYIIVSALLYIYSCPPLFRVVSTAPAKL